MINKYPYEIETPLDRRAATIDILAGELERKNRNIGGWRKKVDELKERIEVLETELNDVRTEMYSLQARATGLDKELANRNYLERQARKKAAGFYDGRLTESKIRKKKKGNGKETETKF